MALVHEFEKAELAFKRRSWFPLALIAMGILVFILQTAGYFSTLQRP
jgi:hypothetical protein